jgi:hypothetical protein
MDAGQPPLDHLAQVLEQVPTIRHLNRLGSAQGGTTGILGGAVARDHLDRAVAFQPLRQGLRGAVGEQVDHPPHLQVDQNGPVGPPLLQGPIVHPQHAGRRALGQRNGAHEA